MTDDVAGRRMQADTDSKKLPGSCEELKELSMIVVEGRL